MVHRRVVVRIAGFAVALALTPWPADAHAVLVRSSPTRRAVLAQPPRRVELVFNERLEAAYSSLSVWSAEGAQVDIRDVSAEPADPRVLSVGVPPLAPGVYTVKFRVLSVDGHVVEGTFPFTVRGAAAR